MLASAIGSLTQPLFYRGANIARLKQAKAQEEQAKIQFQTTLLKAGNEVGVQCPVDTSNDLDAPFHAKFR